MLVFIAVLLASVAFATVVLGWLQLRRVRSRRGVCGWCAEPLGDHWYWVEGFRYHDLELKICPACRVRSARNFDRALLLGLVLYLLVVVLPATRDALRPILDGGAAPPEKLRLALGIWGILVVITWQCTRWRRRRYRPKSPNQPARDPRYT